MVLMSHKTLREITKLVKSIQKKLLSYRSTMKYQLLVGDMMIRQEQSTGLEETHGELTGEITDSS